MDEISRIEVYFFCEKRDCGNVNTRAHMYLSVSINNKPSQRQQRKYKKRVTKALATFFSKTFVYVNLLS
jgi:hypothetical protein